MATRGLGAAAEFAEAQFGGILQHNFDIQTIGVARSQIHGNDPEMVETLFMNLSANTIYIGFDQAVGPTRGVILTALGGFISLNAKDDSILPTIAQYAIASAASSPLLVLTVRRIRRFDEEEP